MSTLSTAARPSVSERIRLPARRAIQRALAAAANQCVAFKATSPACLGTTVAPCKRGLRPSLADEDGPMPPGRHHRDEAGFFCRRQCQKKD